MHTVIHAVLPGCFFIFFTGKDGFYITKKSIRHDYSYIMDLSNLLSNENK